MQNGKLTFGNKTEDELNKGNHRLKVAPQQRLLTLALKGRVQKPVLKDNECDRR